MTFQLHIFFLEGIATVYMLMHERVHC